MKALLLFLATLAPLAASPKPLRSHSPSALLKFS